MRIKSRRSTAQLLGDYREALRIYYNSVRAGNLRPRPGNTFPMNVRHMTDRIEAEELEKHERQVDRTAAIKLQNEQ